MKDHPAGDTFYQEKEGEEKSDEVMWFPKLSTVKFKE